MRLCDLLSKDVIRIPLKSDEKYAIIREMVDILCRAKNFKDCDGVLDAVLEREKVMSTGMGDGVAIPHAKTDAVDDLVAAFGITEKPVDFDSIDNQPVRMVFLLVAPAGQTGPHLKALSRISRLMHREDFRERLALARDGEQVIATIEQVENKYFPL